MTRASLSPTLDGRAVELGGELVTLASRLMREVRRRADLPAGTRVLSLLDQQGPLGITALAAADRCSQPTMSAAVRALEDQGLVVKRSHPTDSRAAVVTLTPAGSADLAALRRRTGESVARTIAAHPTLSSEQLATAVAVLRGLLETSDTAGEAHS